MHRACQGLAREPGNDESRKARKWNTGPVVLGLLVPSQASYRRAISAAFLLLTYRSLYLCILCPSKQITRYTTGLYASSTRPVAPLQQPAPSSRTTGALLLQVCCRHTFPLAASCFARKRLFCALAHDPLKRMRAQPFQIDLAARSSDGWVSAANGL